jgi:hypothetical protein
LWNLIEFYDENGERRFREKKPAISSTPSDAASVDTDESATLAASATTFGAAPTAEQQAAADAERDDNEIRIVIDDDTQQ